MDAFFSQPLDDLETMADGARKAVDPDDEEGVGPADVVQEFQTGQGERAKPRTRVPGRLPRSRLHAVPFPALRSPVRP